MSLRKWLLLVLGLTLLTAACGGNDCGATHQISSWADLTKGDCVAVQTGTTGEIWAKANLEP